MQKYAKEIRVGIKVKFIWWNLEPIVVVHCLVLWYAMFAFYAISALSMMELHKIASSIGSINM